MAQRQHKRLDTVKMFEPDEANMKLAMERLKTKNRSEVHRYTLEFFCLASDLKPLLESFRQFKTETKSRDEELYFIVQGLAHSIQNLSRQLEQMKGAA